MAAPIPVITFTPFGYFVVTITPRDAVDPDKGVAPRVSVTATVDLRV